MVLFDSEMRDMDVRNFPKGISPKVNLIAWAEFELANNDVTDKHVSYSVKGTPSNILVSGIILFSTACTAVLVFKMTWFF